MNSELYWTVASCLLTAVLFFPYVLQRIFRNGLGAALGNPPANWSSVPEWAQRAKAAHVNAVENLVVFAPLVLSLQALHLSTPATRLAAQVYFWARLGHYLVFCAGVPGLRTVFFFLGLGCQVLLSLTGLGWI